MNMVTVYVGGGVVVAEVREEGAIVEVVNATRGGRCEDVAERGRGKYGADALRPQAAGHGHSGGRRNSRA